MKKIVLVGAGGHCKVIVDIIKGENEFEIVGITDKNPSEALLLDVPIIGDDGILNKLYDDGVEYAFICIGALENPSLRNKIYKQLKAIGFKLPILTHKNSVVSPYSHIEEGTCVAAGTVINAGAHIGKNCIINTGSIIEHDCIIGNNTHISPRVALGGGVKIGSNTHIGIGSSVIQCIKIGNDVIVGAGAVVINNIENSVLAVGMPAKVIKFIK